MVPRVIVVHWVAVRRNAGAMRKYDRIVRLHATIGRIMNARAIGSRGWARRGKGTFVVGATICDKSRVLKLIGMVRTWGRPFATVASVTSCGLQVLQTFLHTLQHVSLNIESGLWRVSYLGLDRSPLLTDAIGHHFPHCLTTL